MIDKIVILSRKNVEKMLTGFFRIPEIEGGWALISIYNDRALIDVKHLETLRILECINYISLRFDDVTKEQYDYKIRNGHKLNLFTYPQAQSIIHFIDLISNNPNIKTLVVHCAAGISRSGAVGLFACKYLKLNAITFMRINPNIHPNEYVLYVLEKASKGLTL